MAVQMPAEAVGTAVGVVIYSFFSFFGGLLLIWLVWTHNERKSYVLLLQAFMTLHTLASITQQIHTIVNWNDIKTSQWENVRDNVGNPELSITGASTGLDLPLFYIQYYCYNVESMLVVCWAVELANSIFQVRVMKQPQHAERASMGAKLTAIFMPVVMMLVLRFTPIQKSTAAFLFVSSGIMVFCFLVGAIVLLCILVRYIYSRFTLSGWNVRYGQNATEEGTGTGNDTSTRPSVIKPRMKSIYDRWLVTRFSIAFVALALFQLVVVNYQLRASATNKVENIPAEADLSAERAVSDVILYMPGCTASLLLFLIFGTTRNFRNCLWETFAPKFLQKKRDARKEAKRHKSKPSVVIPDPNYHASPRSPTGAKPLPPLPKNDEEAQFDYEEDGIRMQNIGVNVWIEGGAKAGAAGMGPDAFSSSPQQRTVMATTTTTMTTVATPSHLKSDQASMNTNYLSPVTAPGMRDDTGYKSETDDDFPIMKHSSRNTSHSMVDFIDQDSSDVESQRKVARPGSSRGKETRWP
ncbi:hypothetical protein QBC38DRAFT_235604 [Podospora fimiseda]|uniref:Glycoside hydrolase n=1 Tax=Podospora fimiseda TaxID=252190 RepID=A0AAN7BMQ6_9PEZI|nr:hypothetical protein QBC38DRAFT_235604 [Podospora fimiseda]